MRAVACALIALLPAAAGADGMTYYIDEGQVAVQATEQRAVLWLNDGTWELHLQPIFQRQAGGAAWVVPFPVLPEVSQGEVDLLDQLELLTAPAFLQTCYIPCCGECLDGGVGADQVDGGDGLVSVWAQGSMGEMDFVVISADDGNDAITWLVSNGYRVPDLARGPLVTLAQEGAYFFAARLAADTDPTLPLPTVRFRLPDLDNPMYPLRTTAAGVGQGRLGLTLWVVAPADRLWWPERFTVGAIDQEHPCSGGEYQAALTALFSAHREHFLALRANLHLANSERYLHKQVCDYGSAANCLPLSELGVEVPDAWTADLQTMAAQDARILRFEGRLSATDMASDLAFLPGDEADLPRTEVTFTCGGGACYSCDDPNADGGGSGGGSGGGCSLAAPGSLVVGAGLLLSLALLLGMRRRA